MMRCFRGSGSSAVCPSGDDSSSRQRTPLPPLTAPKLIILDLNPVTTGDRLRTVFERFGPVLEAEIVPHLEDNLENYARGYVLFERMEDAEKARRGMNGRFINGYVVFCVPEQAE